MAAHKCILGLLGIGSRSNRRAGSLLGWSYSTQTLQTPGSAASALRTLPRPPFGRQYVPSVPGLDPSSWQAYTPSRACVSITVQTGSTAAGGGGPVDSNTRIVVISGSGSTSALSGPAQATAAGAWPALPTWLFGFACGTAAATAAAHSYYITARQHKHQHHQHLDWDPNHVVKEGDGNNNSGTSSNALADPSSSVGVDSDKVLHALLSPLSYPANGGSNDDGIDTILDCISRNDSNTKSSNGFWPLPGMLGLWGYLRQLVRLAAAPVKASIEPHSGRLLPTPWEEAQQLNTTTNSSSDVILGPAAATAAAAAAGTTSASAAAPAATGSCSGGDAVLMRSSISHAAAAAAPAVVHLVAAGARSAAAAALAGPDTQAQGSGFIYDPSGYIITNAHVVLGTEPPAIAAANINRRMAWQQQQHHSSSCTNAATGGLQPLNSSGNNHNPATIAAAANCGVVSVHMHDGRVFDGHVVALDRASDIAVVAVQTHEPLPAVKLGNSQRLRVGEWVVALGSPFLLKHSVTAGIVSCVERKGSELGMHSPRTEFIQTDARINAGNSGGPLVNLDGEVVGMNNMRAAGGDGVSFAIPADTIKQLLSEISRYGRVRRPYVGITMTEVVPSRMGQLRAACPDFPANVSAAILVTRVAANSPAAAAGLHEDDIIVSVTNAKRMTRQVVTDSIMQVDSGNPISVSSFAEALQAAIGGGLELLVVREQHQHDKPGVVSKAGDKQNSKGKGSNSSGDVAGTRGSSNSSSGCRYTFVTLKLSPVEAPPN